MFTPLKNIEDREYLILYILLTYLYLKPDVNCSYYRFDFFPQPLVYSSANHKSNFQREMEDLALVQVRARDLCFLCIECTFWAPPLRLLPAFVNRDFLNPYVSLTTFNFQLFATWLFHCKFSPFIIFYPCFNGSFLGLIMFIFVTFGIKPICY